MAVPTNRVSEIAKKWVDLVKDDALTIGQGLALVRYGDSRTFPKVPMLCIEPAQMVSEYQGAPLQTRNDITIAFLIYHTGTSGVEEIQFEADTLSDDLADYLNQESTGIPWG